MELDFYERILFFILLHCFVVKKLAEINFFYYP